MSMSIFETGLPLYKIMEAAERSHEIRPFTPRHLERELGIDHRQAGRLVDLFIELGIVALDRIPRHGYVPLVSSQAALLAVIDLLHSELCVGCSEEIDDEDEDDDTFDIMFPDPFDDVSEDSLPFFPYSFETKTEEDSEYLRKAVETVCAREVIGTSALQRALQIGYGRAAGLIDTLETLGIVGPDPGNKRGRPVLLSLEEALARLSAMED